MATNIFDPSDFIGIKNRINQLSDSSQRQWGRMTLPQTLEHCSIQLKKALGIIPESASEGSSFYRNPIGRWLILYGLTWPKGASTPSEMNMETNEALVIPVKEAKNALLSLLEKVQTEDQFNSHPFFGKMDKKTWGRLMWKHLDHHLKQFGS